MKQKYSELDFMLYTQALKKKIINLSGVRLNVNFDFQ